MTIQAKYDHGVFRPFGIVMMEEGTIVEVVLPAAPPGSGARRSVKDLAFYGIWKDRADIGDGPGYVNRLRDDPRGQGGG